MQFELNQAKEILSRTPSTLKSLLDGLSDEWVLRNEGPDTWSPFDVVGHLIHGEKTDWVPRAKIILEHGESCAFEPFDRFAMFRDSQGKTLRELLTEFEYARRDSLKELDALQITPEQLTIRGNHPELGVVTLGQLLSTWVVHDLNHIGQIVRVMAKQYRDEVGPWTAYLSILNR